MTASENGNKANGNSAETTHSQVSQYYGSELKTSKDLKTNACCTAAAPPKYIRDCIANIHDDVILKYYGCGLCLPQYNLDGCRILDLGCGAGRDVYIASQLVGASGSVVGVDMTPEQLEVAKSTMAHHAEKFGFANVEFRQGFLEKLDEIQDLEPESFDVIISNCVINLCADKDAVLKHCFRLLKPGGELYFSDVYATRRVPQSLREDPVLWGECLSGALYWNDFENMARKAGFTDPRLVEDAPITIQSCKVQGTIKKAGQEALKFFSATYRLFKVAELDPHGEDYGLAVSYKGSIPRYLAGWSLDKDHLFEAGKITPVCANTYRMLQANSKLKEHFDFYGNFNQHFGIFQGRGPAMPFDIAPAASGKGSSSCC